MSPKDFPFRILKKHKIKLLIFLLILAIFIWLFAGSINLHKLDVYFEKTSRPKLPDIFEVDYCKSLLLLSLNSKPVAEIKVTPRLLVMIAVNKLTSQKTFERVFDIARWYEHEEELIKILNGFPPNRIVVIISANHQILHFSKDLTKLFKFMGSKMNKNRPPNNWIFVYDVDRKSKVEKEFKTTSVGRKKSNCVHLKHEFDSVNSSTPLKHCSSWPNTHSYQRRTEFCVKHDSYNNYCDCDKHLPIDFTYKPLRSDVNGGSIDNVLTNTPVVVMAAKRPFYLIACLQSLLSVRGTNPNNVHVFIDGDDNETIAVVKLFNLKYTFHPHTCDGLCAVNNHYRVSLGMAFDTYPKATEIIILEEDLEVAPDFMLFMAETIPLLRRDKSLYCVSAWNDQSYLYTLGDPTGLFETDFMPGLGWALLRSVYEKDLKSEWLKAGKELDWDYWMRDNKQRQRRYCVVPDISRTFHAGLRGNTMTPGMFRDHFVPRPKYPYYVTHFNTFWLQRGSYAIFLKTLIKLGKIATDYSGIIEDFNKSYSNYKNGLMYANLTSHTLHNGYSFDELVNRTSVLFINIERSIAHNWDVLTTRFKLWKLDVRDFFQGTTRIWLNNHHYILVMYPNSTYSSLKPTNLIPLPLFLLFADDLNPYK